VKWTRNALSSYGRDVTPTLDRLDEEFGNGVSLCCLLHAYGEPGQKPDMRRVFWEPQTDAEERSNISYALKLLEKNDVPCVFDVDTWCHYTPPIPDRSCLMLLLRDMLDAWGHLGVPKHGEAQAVVYRDEARIAELEKRAARPVTGLPVSVQVAAQAR